MNHSDSPSPLSGAWRLVSGYYVGDDGVKLDYAAAGVQSLKLLSAGRFSFVTTAGGAFYAAAAGDYAAADGLYAEIPVLASQPEMIGSRFEFQYRLEGNTWSNARWQDGVCVEYEVWQRVEEGG